MISYLFVLGVLGGVMWFWYDTTKSHQIARVACKHACKQLQLQLLDDTIALSQLRITRADSGQMRLQRTYEFEFSADFETRHQGMIQLEGHQVRLLEFPGFMDRTILPV